VKMLLNSSTQTRYGYIKWLGLVHGSLSLTVNNYHFTNPNSCSIFFKQVVEETIRMANIAAVIFRMATREVEYKGTSDH